MATPNVTAQIPQATTQISATKTASSIRAAVWDWITRLWRGLVFARGHRIRQRRIDELNRLSDGELADLGLSRDQIVHFVYRDLIG